MLITISILRRPKWLYFLIRNQSQSTVKFPIQETYKLFLVVTDETKLSTTHLHCLIRDNYYKPISKFVTLHINIQRHANLKLESRKFPKPKVESKVWNEVENSMAELQGNLYLQSSKTKQTHRRFSISVKLNSQCLKYRTDIKAEN